MTIANAISDLVSTIENMNEPIILWYYFFLEILTFISVFYFKIADFFIEILTVYTLLK